MNVYVGAVKLRSVFAVIGVVVGAGYIIVITVAATVKLAYIDGLDALAGYIVCAAVRYVYEYIVYELKI